MDINWSAQYIHRSAMWQKTFKMLVDLMNGNGNPVCMRRPEVFWHELDIFEDVLWVCGGWSYPVGYMMVAHITTLKITWSPRPATILFKCLLGQMSSAHSGTWWATMFSAPLSAWRRTTECCRRSFLPVAVKLFTLWVIYWPLHYSHSCLHFICHLFEINIFSAAVFFFFLCTTTWSGKSWTFLSFIQHF